MAGERTEAELKAYYKRRLERLGGHVVQLANTVLGAQAIEQHGTFEKRVEESLKEGAKFVPRKRQPR